MSIFEEMDVFENFDPCRMNVKVLQSHSKEIKFCIIILNLFLIGRNWYTIKGESDFTDLTHFEIPDAQSNRILMK